MNRHGLSLTLVPSRLLERLCWTIHLAALVALWTAALFPGLAAALTLVIGLHAWHLRERLALLADGTVTGVRLVRGDWLLQVRRAGTSVDVKAQLDPDYRLCPWFVSLRFREPGTKHAHDLLLLPDAADAEELRRLRVRLNLKRE